jgi:hypothetical protein
MRLAVSLLTCVVVSALTPAFADPPPIEASANATSPASSAPATVKPAASAAATPVPAAEPAAEHPAASAAQSAPITASVDVEAAQMDQLEKHFVSEGYKVELHNGDKYYCRHEEKLGSRLGRQKQCATAQQLMFTEKDARRQLEHAQRNQTSTP